MPSKKNKKRLRLIQEKKEEMLRMGGPIDESEISARQRAEALELEAMLQGLNDPYEGASVDVVDVPTKEESSTTTEAPAAAKSGVRYTNFDKQRAVAEELELRLLEFGDYESRLDDDFIGDGKEATSNIDNRINNNNKTTALSFYNADAPKVDPRILAEDLESKLLLHNYSEAISKGEITGDFAKPWQTYERVGGEEINDVGDGDLPIICPPEEQDIYGLGGNEYEELAADSSVAVQFFSS